MDMSKPGNRPTSVTCFAYGYLNMANKYVIANILVVVVGFLLMT